jgi:protein SCO1/2
VKKVLLAVLATLAALALVVGCSSSGGGQAPVVKGLDDHVSSGPYLGEGVTPPRPRPSFTLLTDDNKPYAFSRQTDGRTTLLFFGYTRCPDICPATMADIGVALRGLPASVSSKVTVVFVSTDVKHDTGPIISRWLQNFTPGTHATFVGLHGSQAQVDAAQAAAHVLIAEDGGKTHSTQVMLYSPDNYAHVSFIYNNNNESAQIKHDVSYVVDQSA